MKKPKPKKASAKTSQVSAAPPGLVFLNRLANQPSRTPRRKRRLRKIESFPLSSDIFSSSSKMPSSQVKSSAEDDMLTRRDHTKLKPVKQVCSTKPDGLRRINYRWLQLFLLNCGQKKKQKIKPRKSSQVKSSLERKLGVSEISCERKSSTNKSCVTKPHKSSSPFCQNQPSNLKVHLHVHSHQRFVLLTKIHQTFPML